MPTDPYPRVRLWAGICSIGLHLSLIWALYLSAAWWVPRISHSVPTLVAAGVLALLITASSFCFDVLTGHAVETALGRTSQSFSLWFQDWLAGAGRLGVALWIGFYLLSCLYAKPLDNLFVISAVLFFLLLFLVWRLDWWIPAGWVSHHPAHEAYGRQVNTVLREIGLTPIPLLWIHDRDRETVNGALQPLGKPRIWLSTNLTSQFTPRQTALLVARELWFYHSGAGIAGVLISLLWILVAWAGAYFMPARHPLEAAVGGAAFVTTWCFVALFVWPHLNRSWMLRADRSLLLRAPLGEVQALLETVQRLNRTDITLPTGITAIFHPIPPLQQRLENLK